MEKISERIWKTFVENFKSWKQNKGIQIKTKKNKNKPKQTVETEQKFVAPTTHMVIAFQTHSTQFLSRKNLKFVCEVNILLRPPLFRKQDSPALKAYTRFHAWFLNISNAQAHKFVVNERTSTNASTSANLCIRACARKSTVQR